MTSLALNESPTWRLTDWFFDKIGLPYQSRPAVQGAETDQIPGGDLLLDVMQGQPEAFMGEVNFQETMAWYHFRQ